MMFDPETREKNRGPTAKFCAASPELTIILPVRSSREKMRCLTIILRVRSSREKIALPNDFFRGTEKSRGFILFLKVR